MLNVLPEKLSEKIAASGPAVQCPVRRYQRPIIGSDGQAMRDDDGHVLIVRVEERTDTMGDTLSSQRLIRRQPSPEHTSTAETAEALPLRLGPLTHGNNGSCKR